MGLPKSSSNKTSWAISGQPTIIRRVTSVCDKFIFRTIQLSKSIISNRIQAISNMIKDKEVCTRNIPFMIHRWVNTQHLFHNLHKWNFHPHYEFPLRLPISGIAFDFGSGEQARESGDPNNCFHQLLSANNESSGSVTIFTDGSKTNLEDGSPQVGCAMVIPDRGLQKGFKLNNLSSSFTAEAFAIIESLDYAMLGSCSSINICSDSLSVLTKLNSGLDTIFPFNRTDLSPIIMDVLLKIYKVRYLGIGIRFTWCPAHIGIKGNELADQCAKLAAVNGNQVENLVSYKEVFSFLHEEYDRIDSLFIEHISQGTGMYYTSKFRDVKVKFVDKLVTSRRDAIALLRILSGYTNTNNRLFKMGIADSPDCNCGYSPQDLNHLFWACPLLIEQRQKLCLRLHQLKLQNPFSIESLLGNINKEVAIAICKFINNMEGKLNVRI